jgi:hypothetical protein
MTETSPCELCRNLESLLPEISAELRRIEGAPDYFRQTARLLLKRKGILEELALHQRSEHLKAS